MPFIYLLLALFSSLLVAVLLKFYEIKQYNRYTVIASNYIIAGTIGLFLLKSPQLPSMKIIIFGGIVGFFFFISFVIFSKSIQKEGIAPTITISRLSLGIPVLCSILFWSERPSLTDIVCLLTIMIIILFWEAKLSKISPTLILLFFLFGLVDSSLKYFDINFPNTSHSSMLIILFYSALIWGWIYIFLTKRTIKKEFIFGGLVLGIPNFFSTFFILKSLSSGIPAYITFPFLSIGLIITSALIGRFIFKEILPRRKYYLILIAITAILFLAI